MSYDCVVEISNDNKSVHVTTKGKKYKFDNCVTRIALRTYGGYCCDKLLIEYTTDIELFGVKHSLSLFHGYRKEHTRRIYKKPCSTSFDVLRVNYKKLN